MFKSAFLFNGTFIKPNKDKKILLNVHLSINFSDQLIIINVFHEQCRIHYLARSPCSISYLSSYLLDLGLRQNLCSLSSTRSWERFDKTKNWQIRGTCSSAVSSTNWTKQARQHCPPTARKVIHFFLVLSFAHSVPETNVAQC